ncbi:DUF2235 domain-containing protein [Vibrio aestuarianus]|uniref:DUF2235 domain-containing protein n=1 Tax=Vibrio aestuarianus TaxID=28171 RepID=A0AAX3U4X8_9VIBR|nr:DUF2235 domain-containing protein [Vibrio aestuarianus]WGK82557.1 DUF2235 domain-containing protein [Vibrio aestuarianus]
MLVHFTATGWGASYRIRDVYSFLIDNYENGDQIYIFGFSRGAYQARILTSLLHHAGIPSIQNQTINSKDLAGDVYLSFKGKFHSSAQRRNAVNQYYEQKHLTSIYPEVQVLGLWDTVESFGWLDGDENIDNPNSNYGDQLCNVRNAFQAVSLDDNRATIFTPLLITRKHLFEQCDPNERFVINNLDEFSSTTRNVFEVWFSGAHSDVGGGYNTSDLNQVSLDWMVSLISSNKFLSDAILLPVELGRINNDPLELSHNARSGLGWFYRKMQRKPSLYTKSEKDSNIAGIVQEGKSMVSEISIHASAIERITTCTGTKVSCRYKAKHELNWAKEFPNCFIYDSEKQRFNRTPSDLSTCNIKVVQTQNPE